jgi:hypothetical protein
VIVYVIDESGGTGAAPAIPGIQNMRSTMRATLLYRVI